MPGQHDLAEPLAPATRSGHPVSAAPMDSTSTSKRRRRQPPPPARPPPDDTRSGYGEAVTTNQDRWARWVLERRDAGDVQVRRHGAALLAAYRDGVLDRAAVTDGDVLPDVGTGNGLIGFAALDRVGPEGQVIFSDVSADLLAECRRRAAREGLLDRCRFVQTGADELRAIPDGSIDVVTTRSVLIYVERKPAAFAEFYRVLRPGGRLSIFEPINGFAVAEAGGGLFGLDVAAVADHRLGGTEEDRTQPAGSHVRGGAGASTHRSGARPLRRPCARRPRGRRTRPQDARDGIPARCQTLTAGRPHRRAISRSVAAVASGLTIGSTYARL